MARLWMEVSTTKCWRDNDELKLHQNVLATCRLIHKFRQMNRLMVRLNVHVIPLQCELFYMFIYTAEITVTRVINFRCGVIYQNLKIAVDN